MTESPHESLADPHSTSARSARSAGSPADPRRRVKIGSPGSVLAVIPLLLGFHPAQSLVVLGVGGPRGRIRMTFRYDLPDPPDRAIAAEIAAHAAAVLRGQEAEVAIMAGYGPGPLVTPVTDAVAAAVRKAGLRIHDILRVESGRYWSYVCREPRCCPPEGVPFDATGHPAARVLAAAGLTALNDRAELAATLAPDLVVGEPVRLAMKLALARSDQMTKEALATGPRHDFLRPFVESGRAAVRAAIGRYREDGSLTDPIEIAWLGLTLRDVRVRDVAWACMEPGHWQAHRRLWTDLVRRLPPGWVAPPAALLAFSAWQSGEGALASIAVERSLRDDPEYSLAMLIGDALRAGLPPSAARLAMTPEEVVASYDEQARQRAARQRAARQPRARRR